MQPLALKFPSQRMQKKVVSNLSSDDCPDECTCDKCTRICSECSEEKRCKTRDVKLLLQPKKIKKDLSQVLKKVRRSARLVQKDWEKILKDSSERENCNIVTLDGTPWNFLEARSWNFVQLPTLELMYRSDTDTTSLIKSGNQLGIITLNMDSFDKWWGYKTCVHRWNHGSFMKKWVNNVKYTTRVVNVAKKGVFLTNTSEPKKFAYREAEQMMSVLHYVDPPKNNFLTFVRCDNCKYINVATFVTSGKDKCESMYLDDKHDMMQYNCPYKCVEDIVPSFW